MMRTWAMELARNEITVNALIPVAATAMTSTIPFFAAHVEALERDGIPLPDALRKGEGFGTVEDVAGLVVFLASDAAAQVNGQEIAAAWPSTFGRSPETVGVPAPQL
jgi:NAD(P)-dependent dehydrogenase (short-subunit alcohol dehydrogenase family)